MSNSHLFNPLKDNQQDHANNFDNTEKNPTFNFGSMVLDSSSLKLKDSGLIPNHGKINPKNRSCSSMNFGSVILKHQSSNPSHSQDQKVEKKEEEEEGHEADGPFHLLLSKDNYKLKVEEEDEEEEEEDDDDDDEYDGFRTPTSLDQRIPEVKQCPHAPRKPKPFLKRKAPHTRHIITPLDLSTEIELLFPSQHNPLSCSYQINKKVRRDHDLK